MRSEVIILPIMILSIAYILYTFINTRHKERMTLIESGRDASLFSAEETPRYFGALKWGLALLFLGLALGIGLYYDFTRFHRGPFLAIPLSIAGGGAGLLTYYLMIKDKMGR